MSVSPVTSDTALNPRTRQRLLEVAGQVFAERGFRGATIREICRRAEANVAAVNYHFQGKEGLYAACLSYWLNEALAQHPPDMGITAASTPEQRLHAFVRSLVYRILDNGRHAFYGKLMARNLVEPTPLFDTFLERSVRPLMNMLHGIIRQIVGPDVSEQRLRLASLSVIGQVTFHRHAQPMLARLYPDLSYSEPEMDRLAEQITEFSLAGLRQIASQGQADQQQKTESADAGTTAGVR